MVPIISYVTCHIYTLLHKTLLREKNSLPLEKNMWGKGLFASIRGGDAKK